MIKVGITGQSGFIGTHLFNFLSLKKDDISLIPFKDDYFHNLPLLHSFVQQCDTVVHLAALNRHGDPQVIYDTNISLVKQLIAACDTTNSRPHILFSSSTQEEKDNPYGNSKREGRQLFESWAARNHAQFTGLIIPNVFGPFGHPWYNSVVATFCHQLTHGEVPHIDVDATMKLIYVGELVKVIHDKIKGGEESTGRGGERKTFMVPFTSENKVSEILAILLEFKTGYFEKGIFPDLSNTFARNLFNTFLCYVDHQKFFPFLLKQNTDERGSYCETVKMKSGGQVSFSTTRPGITRGNHFHTRKAERFAVIKGKARIELRRVGTDKILTFDLDGDKISFVDMPVWFTHNITNVGKEDLYTVFWTNEMFDPEDTDTYSDSV
jgi:UDP-2-acetamido-2,6-beta-L-arabino-hexul-4-ose reductase